MEKLPTDWCEECDSAIDEHEDWCSEKLAQDDNEEEVES